MLTAAVRDLHSCYPGSFLTDVRTLCPDLWEHNPYITPLDDQAADVETVECSYPLINRANKAPYHCLHGFIEFLNERLRLAIRPTLYKGDIHLSAQEKAWYSQVHEVTRKPIPFWIIAAGGKYDLTIKWWQTERYQQVVDYFHGRIQFVQIGGWGHHHPGLKGAMDLRGQTSLRELVRLVHHAQGVLCSVTGVMHLAAAVPTQQGTPPNRPCVVVAGGREPAHWEAYPDHQFIHTNGALSCCAKGGCWRDRTFRLRDGDHRDRPANLCVDVVETLPRCMDMISAQEVIRRIELYFQGGVVKYLAPRQRVAAERGVHATAKNAYDRQPLNLHNAGFACQRFISTIPPYPDRFEGRGIVICAGGVRYFTNAWVCINVLRRLGCRLPIQVWYRGKQEMNQRMKALLEPLGVECVDASKLQKKFPARRLGGWELKPYAILHCPFREVLLLDADNVAVVDPEFLFDSPEFQKTGAIFWPDYDAGKNKKLAAIWRSCGMRQPAEREFESGQILVDKSRCWAALSLAVWFNDQSDFYYQYLHGDKETFHLAFRKLKTKYALVPKPIHGLPATMCQHDFQGRRIFQHRNCDKWDLFLRNKRIPDFWLEQECRDYILQLREKWDGGMSHVRGRKTGAPAKGKPKSHPVRIEALVIANGTRSKRTLASLTRTDWNDVPLCVEATNDETRSHIELQSTRAGLKKFLQTGADYVLFLADDLALNRNLRHNLRHWAPVKTRKANLASVYNPGAREFACDISGNSRIAPPHSPHGDSAFLLSRKAIERVLRRWSLVKSPGDLKISRLAAWLKDSVFYHAPSLAQRTPKPGETGAGTRHALDFDPAWKA